MRWQRAGGNSVAQALIFIARLQLAPRVSHGPGQEHLLLPEVAGQLERLQHDGDLVFHTREGKGMANNVWRDSKAIVRRAGMADRTIHDLRRTFESQLTMAGVSAALTQTLAGHAPISTTVRHYTGVTP